MDNQHSDWYGEERRQNGGRRRSDRGTEPPRPERYGDVRRATSLHSRDRYTQHQTKPYRGGPLGSELRDPYERERPYEREHARRDTEMIYYSPYGGPTSSGGFAGRGPKGYRRSDDRIREDVCERLAEDPVIDASDMEVTVKDGEVTLSGTANARSEKRRAEDVIEGVSGVRDIHNQLRVSGDRREER
jgi:hypothetical protein